MMAIHTHPSEKILLPMMHPNIAQIGRWWVASTIIGQTFIDTPFLSLMNDLSYEQVYSLHMEARPSNIAPLLLDRNSGDKDSHTISHHFYLLKILIYQKETNILHSPI
jgi:hypothetical protein